ncbi:MAG TPA: 16S rRNA (cytidine(1402)-2'-O)-methyltransferase [Candidatus Yonathbacteria bacterium]|nr:16S rRNA (cytidine(1402)-2'-O)-methyltransferase [Candidatus Yonathbacteria bacterium]
MSKLYIVATPIGNLEDVTLRAIRVLKEVDLILCEDTRVTKKLLNKYDIDTPTMSYHAHSKITKAEKIIGLLSEGKNLALVSDAGTPAISDPGVLLVKQVRDELKDEVQVLPIPGPSAVISALSASGLPSSEFVFLGFLPHKKGRETLFKEIANSKRTVAFYESPHRILKALHSLTEHLGVRPPSERQVVVARELTKIHEEIISGSPKEVEDFFQNNPEKVRGEFVVLVSPA